MTDDMKWRKSSFSSQETNCVEVAWVREDARVRDTKDRRGGYLDVADSAWSAFLGAVKTQH
jgi:hypothetical protein